MVVPVSVDAQFRRLDKNLQELKQIKGDALDEDKSILVAEICNSCILTLDKVMNAIWEAKGEKEGRQKPRIYFPAVTRSKEKLTEKLQQYQMPDLEGDEPEIFELIDSVQLYRGVSWLRAVYSLAAIRHERYPRMSQVNKNFVGFGAGQDLFVESAGIDGSGKIFFKGRGINRISGEIEPVRVGFFKEVRSVLEGVDEEPYQFCSSPIVKVKRLVRELYKQLR